VFAAFIANIFQAYRDPRASARALLSRRPTMVDAMAMLALTFAISEFFGRVMAGFPASPNLFGLVAGLFLLLAAFGIMTMLAYTIGAKFGGKGSLRDIAVVLAWHGLATQAMGPVTYLGLDALRTGTGGPMVLVLLVSLGVSLWMFAAFIAEAHRFARVGPVIGVTLGATVVVMLLVSVLVAGFMDPGVAVQ